MRSLVCAALLIGSAAHAAIVDNGGFTTDTVSGLDWLDLTETTSMTILDAEAAFSGNGWRLATGAEVHDLFDQLYVGFYDNFSYGGSSGGSATDGNLGPAYDGHIEDVRNFHSLFGSV
ncbi:MAG: hypothetical protein ACR2P6_07665, partial [Gammaproteobacteria bacterium]